MDAALPFKPQGTGAWLAVVGSTQTPGGGTKGSDWPASGDVSYLVYNPSGQTDAFIGYGPTSASAVANAQVPLPLTSPIGTSSAGGGFVIAPTGTLQALSLGPNLFFAGRGLGSSSVWIQPGYGV